MAEAPIKKGSTNLPTSTPIDISNIEIINTGEDAQED